MTEPNKALVARYIEEVWNGGSLLALERLTSEGFAYHLGGQPPQDRQAMGQFLQMVHSAFPDWHVEIEEMVADETLVCARWQGPATHKGPFHGIPPTGKSVKVSGMNLYQIEDGRIVKEWEQMDSLGMLMQLGVLPPPTHPEAP